MAKSHKRKSVPAHVAAAIRGKSTQPDLGEVANHFFAMCGGPRAFAKMLLDSINDPKVTPLVRSKTLDLICYITKVAHDRAPPRDDLGLLSDEDLERVWEEIDGRMKPSDDQEEVMQPDHGPEQGAAADATADEPVSSPAE